jgi:polysaccharide biosynthesis PFTS motif protein
LTRLNDILTSTKLSNVQVSKTVETSKLNFELSARQYLYTRILDHSFNKSVLYSIGSGRPLRHPLPKEWRSRLEKEGIRIDNLSCSFLWAGYIFLLWGYGAIQGLKSVIYLLKRHAELGKYIYFDQIDAKNLSSNTEAHNIVNWYLQWENRKTNIDSISHGVNGINDYRYKDMQVSFSDGLPQIRGLNIIKYILWSLYLCLYSLLFITLKPYSSLLLAEQFKLIRVKLANRRCIEDDILFNNSGAFYRPLWTYEAKEKGSRILFYFYSTNNENFKTKNGYPIQNPWHLTSWPYYLVWDEFQAEFIKKNDQHDSIIEVVGAIWLSSNEKNIDIPLNSISVFDITPVRPTKYFWRLRHPEYYIFEIIDQFLSDIHFVLSESNIDMMHKRKRIRMFTHKKYTRRVNQLDRKLNYTNIDPDFDAIQIIQKTKACISMPFTSTALIAKQEGKPSVYYDPTGMIQKDDRAAHGISILSGINELEEWVESINNDKMEEICKN